MIRLEGNMTEHISGVEDLQTTSLVLSVSCKSTHTIVIVTQHILGEDLTL